jgi:hypothetical protein
MEIRETTRQTPSRSLFPPNDNALKFCVERSETSGSEQAARGYRIYLDRTNPEHAVGFLASPHGNLAGVFTAQDDRYLYCAMILGILFDSFGPQLEKEFIHDARCCPHLR